MEKAVITLIIPTHNNGMDLKKSVLSACNQDFDKPFEVIVVADACTDDTVKLVKELQKEHPQINLYEVSNRSLLKNRVFGARHAKGDLLMFLDGDDWIAPNTMSKMYEAMTTCDADLVNCNFNIVRKNKIKKYGFSSDAILNKEQAIDALFKDISFRGFMHTKMFKKDLFLKIEILDKIIDSNIGNMVYEDTLFNFFYLINVNKVKCIKDNLHFYNKTNEESMTSTGYKRAIDYAKVRNLIRMKIEELNDDKIRRCFLKHKFRSKTLLFADIFLSKFPDKQTKHEIKKSVIHDHKNIYSKHFDIGKAIYKNL